MKTIYAVACYYDSDDYPEDTIVLGWNNNYDWYDTESSVADLLTSKGNLKRINYGLIEVDRWTSVYVGEKIEDVKDYAERARKEGIDAKVVKIEIDGNGGVNVIPQEAAGKETELTLDELYELCFDGNILENTKADLIFDGCDDYKDWIAGIIEDAIRCQGQGAEEFDGYTINKYKLAKEALGAGKAAKGFKDEFDYLVDAWADTFGHEYEEDPDGGEEDPDGGEEDPD